MPVEIKVPYLGEVGPIKVVSINKGVGDHVERGEAIFEVEAEKAVYVIESPVSGVVEKINVSLGDRVYPGMSLAVVRETS